MIVIAVACSPDEHGNMPRLYSELMVAHGADAPVDVIVDGCHPMSCRVMQFEDSIGTPRVAHFRMVAG